MTEDERWAVFLAKCRAQLPATCPLCGLDVAVEDPACEEAFDAHRWYEATFGCEGGEQTGHPEDECMWSESFTALVGRDPQFGVSVDWHPDYVRIDL